jgi:RalA-binding protein 1
MGPSIVANISSFAATVAMTFNTVNLYMHELVLNSSAAVESERPPFSTESLTVSMLSADAPPSAAHISALSTCLISIHGCFEVFLAIPMNSARCLPVYFFVRVAYALVILIKMAFSAAKAGSEFGRVIGPEDMKVQYYLDALVNKFRDVSADEQCRPAAKFLIVLAMLRTWVARQVKDGTIIASWYPSTNSDSQAPRSQGPVDPKMNQSPLRSSPSQQPASTPLHLLSEVASNRNNTSEGVSGTASQGPFSRPYFTGIQRVPQPFFADDSSTAPSGAVGVTNSTPSTTSANSAATADMSNWLQSGMGFVYPMPVDPSIMNGSVDLEGVDFATAEPWFTDVFNVMPNMENMFYF